MRAAFIRLHRYIGLFIAAFLFLSGLTGAIISWDRELDALLNPQLMRSHSSGRPQDPFELAKRAEARDPRIRVWYVPLRPEPGHSMQLRVEPAVDAAASRLHDPRYNQLFIDPITGEELGRRQWGDPWPITRESFVPFLFELHRSLHIPVVGGVKGLGFAILGGVAILWMLNSLMGFYLTLPSRRRADRKTASPGTDAPGGGASVQAGKRNFLQRWQPAWIVRWSGGAPRLALDLHRAFSLWTWLVLFLIAFTAFSISLYGEVFYPVMSRFSQATPSPLSARVPSGRLHPVKPILGFRQAVDIAARAGVQRGWKAPPGGVFYFSAYGIYSVSFFEPGQDHGGPGLGPPVLFLDGNDGTVLGTQQPWKGTAADVYQQAQIPLHSGRILGLPGRVLISAMGLVVAMLSVTGVLIWLRKRAAASKSVDSVRVHRPSSGTRNVASPSDAAPGGTLR